MDTNSIILQELKQISPTVAEVGFGMPYEVPAGYFEGLAAAVLNRIKTENLSANDELRTLSPLLSGLSKKVPYQVPDGYFGELAENVVGGMKAVDFVKGELQESSPLLQGLKNKPTYEVPPGYFDNLANVVLNKIQQNQPAKVVKMNPARRFMRYAAAAVITGALAIGGWFYFNQGTTGSTTQIATVEKISDDNKVTDEEMASFIENETLDIASNTVVNDEMDASDVKELLSDVSDDELQNYLITL